MTRGKSDLAWSNIGRNDLDNVDVWDRFQNAKAELELAMSNEAIEKGFAHDGDNFKFSYARIGQGTVGMAIDAQKAPAQASGFGGLKAPKPRENLADWARDRDMRGYRR